MEQSLQIRETPYNTPFILQRADPYVYQHTDGTYYFTASVPAYDRIILMCRQHTEITGCRRENGLDKT